MAELNTYNLEINEGEDLQFPLTWTEKDSGNPIDLTGSQIIFESEDGTYDQTAIMLDEVNGKYQFTLNAADTLGTVHRGAKKTLRYLVKHISSGGLTSYLFRMNILVVGVYD